MGSIPLVIGAVTRLVQTRQSVSHPPRPLYQQKRKEKINASCMFVGCVGITVPFPRVSPLARPLPFLVKRQFENASLTRSPDGADLTRHRDGRGSGSLPLSASAAPCFYCLSSAARRG